MTTDQKELPTKDIEQSVDEGDAMKSTDTKDKSDWSVDRRGSIKETMSVKKAEQRFDLTEDVYALLTVCPVFSHPFLISMLIVILKITVYAILATDIAITSRINTDRLATTAVKFLLVPVSVSMQEDLMGSFFFFANGIYCPTMMKKSKSATERKLYFSYCLRTIDGLFSLYVNFTVMLTTTDTQSVFLNFAALQFLQSIDDVFYDLIEKGFFGDTMEHWAELCSQVSIAKRWGKENNHKFWCFRISHLDTILSLMTAGLCYLAWIVLTIAEYNTEIGDEFYGPVGNATAA